MLTVMHDVSKAQINVRFVMGGCKAAARPGPVLGIATLVTWTEWSYFVRVRLSKCSRVMVRHRRSGGAFWFFLVVLAVGIGWASNEAWRLPLLALFGIEDAPQLGSQQRTEREQPVADTDSSTDAAPADHPGAAAPQEQADPPAETARQDPAPAPEVTERVPDPTGEPPAAPSPKLANESPQEPVSEPAEAAPPIVAAIEPGASQAEPEVEDPAEATPPPSVAATPEGTSERIPGAVSSGTATEPTIPSELRAAEAKAGEQEIEAGQEQAVEEADPADAADERKTAALPEEPALVAPPDAESGTRPSFDIVRVEPDGRAVIAGRAAPGTEVELRSGDQVIDRVRASRRGEWVAIPPMPLSPGDQTLTAVASREDAPPIESDQVVVVAVPEPTRPEPSSAEVIGEAEKPVAVLLPRDRTGPGRILQAPGRLSAEGSLALMTVSYDAEGKILLSGEAPPGVPVRIYVDNRPAAVVVGDAKGTWTSGLDENLEPGTYTLRLDQLDAKGQPVARLETPFTRVSEPPVAGELQVDYVVVQPGNSLWRIARRLSGKGLDYVHIYGTNKAQIRDPDLIYPGQVFEIPAEIGPAG
jgi:nucleoid-associated protein YgaU